MCVQCYKSENHPHPMEKQGFGEMLGEAEVGTYQISFLIIITFFIPSLRDVPPILYERASLSVMFMTQSVPSPVHRSSTPFNYSTDWRSHLSSDKQFSFRFSLHS